MGTGLGAAPASLLQPAAPIAVAEAACRRFAGWIGIVGALTVVNSLVMAFGLDWNFLIGLGVTTIIDVLAKEGAGGAGSVVAVVVALIAGAIFGLLWYFASRGATAAFIVATVLYGLDTLLFVALALGSGGLWLNVALHGLALWYIVRGIGAARAFHKLQAAQAAAVPGAISSSAHP